MLDLVTVFAVKRRYGYALYRVCLRGERDAVRFHVRLRDGGGLDDLGAQVSSKGTIIYARREGGYEGRAPGWMELETLLRAEESA